MQATNHIAFLSALLTFACMTACGKKSDDEKSPAPRQEKRDEKAGDFAISKALSSVQHSTKDGQLEHSHLFFVFNTLEKTAKVAEVRINGTVVAKGSSVIGDATRIETGLVSSDSMQSLDLGDGKVNSFAKRNMQQYKGMVVDQLSGMPYFYVTGFQENLGDETKAYVIEVSFTTTDGRRASLSEGIQLGLDGKKTVVSHQKN